MPKSDTHFKPGNPGRPKGAKNKTTGDIREFCRAVLMPDAKARIAYITNLRARILKGEANHMELFLSQHLYGKPIERIEHSVLIRQIEHSVLIRQVAEELAAKYDLEVDVLIAEAQALSEGRAV